MSHQASCAAPVSRRLLTDKEVAQRKPGRMHLIPLSDYPACKLKWLVECVMVAGQPMVTGGPSKFLKTSLAIELAVSIAYPLGHDSTF
jgi:hypothetical protein